MKFKSILTLIMGAGLLLSLPQLQSFAADPAPVAPAPSFMTTGSPSSGGSGETATPDLFSGSMSYSVPIEVPPGRNGMAPSLSLLYRSGNPNGLLGVGWELEPGAIVRSLKGGVNYSGDEYALRFGGSTIDLVNINRTTGEYRAKMEGSFNRIKKLTDGWEVTDKSGIRYTEVSWKK